MSSSSHHPPARILVLRTGEPLARVHAHCGPFYRLFLRTMNDGEDAGLHVAVDEYDVTSRHEDDPLPSLARYHGVIMTGSPAYVGDDAGWMRWGARLLRRVVDDDVLFLGVCFGHQLLGRALGADVGPNPHGREMGTIDVALIDDGLADDPLFGDAPRTFQAQVTHRDVIRAPGPRLRVLGRAMHDDNHVVRAGRRQWGVQFHPEFDDVTMRLYLEGRCESLDADRGAGATAARLARLTTTPESARLLRRFAQLARQEASTRVQR